MNTTCLQPKPWGCDIDEQWSVLWMMRSEACPVSFADDLQRVCGDLLYIDTRQLGKTERTV